MITNFKIFEKQTESVYWLVNTKQPHFRIALKKLGMLEDEIKYWCEMFDDEEGNNEGSDVYFIRTYDDEDEYYSWNWTYGSLRYDGKFMGKVEVEEHEVDAEKYNL
jgi:hypothetical protein